MFSCTSHSFTQIIGCCWCTHGEAVGIKVTWRDLQHRTGLLKCGSDILGIPALYSKLLICFCSDIFLIGFHLLIVHQLFCFGLRHGIKQRLCTGVLQFTESFEHIVASFLQLPSGKLMSHSLCTRFGFLPVMVGISDEMGGRRVAKLAREVFCQYLSLSYVRIVSGFVAGRIVIYFRGDVAVLLRKSCIKTLCAVPDSSKLRCFQRRRALC